MDYLLLFSAAVFSGATAIFGNLFNCKNASVKNAASLYNLLLAVSVLVGWGIFYLCDLSFEPGVLLYSLGYGGCYVTSVVCLLYAMKHGPVALSSLIMNFSLIVVTVWGMIFWNSKINAVVLSGLCLVVISLLLFLYQHCFFGQYRLRHLAKNAADAVSQSARQYAYVFCHDPCCCDVRVTVPARSRSRTEKGAVQQRIFSGSCWNPESFAEFICYFVGSRPLVTQPDLSHHRRRWDRCNVGAVGHFV